MSVRARASAARRRANAVFAAVTRRAAVQSPSGAPASLDAALDPVTVAMQRDQSDFQHMRQLLAFTLRPDANCIDVGAHRGQLLAEMLRIAPAGRHLAFEPIPELCDLLRKNFPTVEVHQAALSNRPGHAEFAHVRGHAEGWSGFRFRPLPTGEQADVENIEVRLEVLDDVIDPDYSPAVIKVDVEGAEEQVFKGALSTLRRHGPVVIFEHGSGSAETYGTKPADIYQLLNTEAGYRIFDLDGNGPYMLEDFEHTFYSAERVNFVAHP
jgi:FkbM family methyltransferase